MKAGCLNAFVVAFLLAVLAGAQQFATFPDRPELRSPDSRFLIRSVDHAASPSDFSGVFRSLILEELPSGRSWALYDYVGRVAVAWSGNRFVIVTDYVSKRTSRALVFAIDSRVDPFTVEQVTLDKVQLARLVPTEQDVHLLANDHVFVEVTRVEGDALILPVWGYGAHDPKGFRSSCQYDLRAGTADVKKRAGEGASLDADCVKARLLQRSLFVVVTRGHGDDDVLPVFVVQVFHPQDHLVLLHAELRLFTHGQQHGVLFVPRPDAVDHLV